MGAKSSKLKPRANFEFVIGALLLLGSVGITPWISFDPINQPRLLVVSVAGYSCLILLVRQIRQLRMSKLWTFQDSQLLSILSVYFITLICAWFFSGQDLSRQVYGVFGRNNGFLTFTALLFIFATIAYAKSDWTGQSLRVALLLSGGLNLAYGYIQLAGRDPIPWNNQYGPIVWMLGNPNFMSSFLGFFGTYLFWEILYARYKKMFPTNFWRSVCILLSFLNTYLLLQTDSIQGVFVLFLGILIVLALWIRPLITRKVAVVFSVTFGMGVVLVCYGLAGYGPLSERIYQSTLQVRFFYWRAAIRMIIENPIFGFGFDSYGDLYRKYRDSESVLAYGHNLTTNSAHNIFLDLGVAGGLPLLLSYCTLVAYVTFRCLKTIYATKSIKPIYVLFVAIWLVYLLQAFISIHNIALAIFGNVSGGILLSMMKNSDEVAPYGQSKSLIAPLVLGLIGFVLSYPSFKNDADFRSAIFELEGKRLFEVATRWPKNDFFLMISADLFGKNGYGEIGVDLATQATKNNPNNLGAWFYLVENETISEEQKNIYKRNIQTLDPLRCVDPTQIGVCQEYFEP